MDDLGLLARGKTVAISNAAAVDIAEREGGALDWAETRNCTFELTKTALVIFSKRTTADPNTGKRVPTPRFEVTLRGVRV
jgi:hypothetical protein